MTQQPVYMDNHATTRVDPLVVHAMLPYFTEIYGNSGSTSHVFGWKAKEAVDQSRQSIAETINAQPREIVFTSGATESNNLAIRGIAERRRRRGNHLISVRTEHKAVLDPLARLARRNEFEVTLLPVTAAGQPNAGVLDLQQVLDAIRDDTALVSVMLANNEIGVIQDLQQLVQECHAREVIVHTDATQAVGRIPVDVRQLDIDLLSFSAHKVYGPKGVGALFQRRKTPYVRLEPQIDGGGQEGGARSGTLNVPGIVGFARALELASQQMPAEQERLSQLRQRLFDGLSQRLPDLLLNGPDFGPLRLPGNLNCSFSDVDGEALMMSMQNLAVSSGSACTSANPEPSHVLRALGLNDDQTRASLRFGLGRFNTDDEVDFAIETVSAAVERLRRLSRPATG